MDNQKNVCLSDIVDAFYRQDKIDQIDKILTETRILKEYC